MRGISWTCNTDHGMVRYCRRMWHVVVGCGSTLCPVHHRVDRHREQLEADARGCTHVLPDQTAAHAWPVGSAHLQRQFLTQLRALEHSGSASAMRGRVSETRVGRQERTRVSAACGGVSASSLPDVEPSSWVSCLAGTACACEELATAMLSILLAQSLRMNDSS
jgi:hypothetical protein